MGGGDVRLVFVYWERGVGMYCVSVTCLSIFVQSNRCLVVLIRGSIGTPVHCGLGHVCLFVRHFVNCFSLSVGGT